jgi:Bacterial SH3 domain
MLARKADGPLTVHVPAPAQDRPSWGRVGVIAAVGFVVGIGWPRLAGVRLGPTVPGAPSGSGALASPTALPAPAPTSPVSAAPAIGSSPAQAPPAAVASSQGFAPPPPAVIASVPSPGAGPVVSPAPSPATPTAVSVSPGVVIACKAVDGESLKAGECGKISALDAIVMPRLRRLAECPEAADASGKMQLVVHVDFARGFVTIDAGRSHGPALTDALVACAKTDVAGVSLAGVPHENPRYTIGYAVTVRGVRATPPASRAEADTALESAQIVWEVAIVRDAPRISGKILTRLPRGSDVRIGPVKDGWYPLRYGDGFAGEGWVFRGALAR